MQVVILCGGQGKRLLPITKLIPKPMVLINDKPFLLYLINYFKSNNFKNFLLLLGYKHKNITSYFGNGNKYNVNIKYHILNENIKTSKRLYEAKKLLNETFIIVYADNFIVFNIKSYVNSFINSKNNISFLLKKKQNGNFTFSKNNELIYSNNKNKNFKYTELGFILARKKFIFKNINSENKNFNQNFNRFLISKSYTYNIIEQDYYSIGDIQRLALTRNYLSRKKIILIDRDGIINKKPKRGHYVTSWNNLILIKKNIEMMKTLSNEGYSFIIISNQAGLNRNMIKKNKFNELNNKLKLFFTKKNINILSSYYCPHHWIENCECRKPKNGLFIKASKEYLFRLDKVLFIGDQFSDYQAALNSNCYSIIINKKNDFTKKYYKKLLLRTNSTKKVISMINMFYCKNA